MNPKPRTRKLTMPTTILLADDHPVFLKGLSQLLEEEQDFKVVGEAGDGKEAIALVGKLSPDVVVMDINLPNFNGIDATRQIVSDFPETKIVALSIHSGKRFIEDMLRAGAAGYILKECPPEELTNGMRAVIRGEIYLSPSVTGIVVSEFVKAETGLQVSRDHDMRTVGETTSIIHTKLHRPSIPQNHAHRSRLLEQLEKSRRKQLTLISAPAGYGKSILLSCWLENCDCPNAWYLVDESDNNLRQFLIYFLTTFQTIFSFQAQGLMTEIRLQDLCFISAETKAYLEQVLGEQIKDAVVAKWTEITEGWIAGLLLAGLSIRLRGDAAAI